MWGFSVGFRIPYHGDLTDRPATSNHPSIIANLSVASEMIQKELYLGRVAGPFSAPPFPNLVVSPLGLIPKKEPGKFHIIHDLSFPKGNSVNFGMPKECCSVSYENYDYLISLLTSVGQGCFIAKADIDLVFRIIPVHPDDYHLLGFRFGGQYYYDKCLPLGCSVSCKVFEQFSCALQWILQRVYHVRTMSHILDDYIFLLKSESVCQVYLQRFLFVADLFPVKHSKTVVSSTCAIVHGIEVDTVLMQARLPQDKLEAAIDLVKSFSRRKKVTLRELQSCIGTLQFAAKVVVGGRPFLRRLIDLTKGVVKPHFHIRLGQEARLNLAAWSMFLESFSQMPLVWALQAH